MDLFDVLTLLGGLSLFLFGMNLMGASLEKRAGSSLKILLGKLTSRKILGFLTGMGVTAVIQSSSATTVMGLPAWVWQQSCFAKTDQPMWNRCMPARNI